MPALLGSAAPVPAALPLRFSLESDRSAYRIGEPIMLRWRMTNVSQHRLDMLEAIETPGRSDYDAVSLTIGQLTPLGLRRATPIALTGKRSAAQKRVRALQPGASVARSFDLALFASFNGVTLKPGRYSLRAEFDPASGSADPSRAIAQQPVAAPPLTIVLLP